MTSGLLIRTDTERDSPDGKMAIEIYMSDYKQVDGVNIPHTLKQVTPMFVSKIGVGADVYEFAHRHAAIYGILAVLIAAGAGWAASAVFRRG